VRRLLLALTLPALAVSASYCTSYDGADAPAPTEAGVTPDGAIDASATGRQPDAAPDVLDAGPETDAARLLTCADERPCELSSGERCCVFSSGANRRHECNVSGSEGDGCSGSGSVVLASECDDPSDCPAGNVCCHTGNTCDVTIEVLTAKCVSASNCPPCVAGVASGGRLACDPTRAGQCPAGKACLLVDAPLAAGYCAL